MHEFESFVYLDVQKTGSSFICSFLKNFCSEKEIRVELHAGMRADCDKSKLYFMSVRGPLDQYLSLYSFGCQGDGQLFQRLQTRGYGDFYDGTWHGFCHWLAFVLEPENAGMLGAGYRTKHSDRTSELIGYQSYRVLSLAIPDANALLAGCQSKESMRDVYKTHSLVGYTIKHKSLRANLAKLVRTKLRHCIPDQAGALKFIHTEEPHNASDRVDRYASSLQLGKKLKQRLLEREWLLYEEFGYKPKPAADQATAQSRESEETATAMP